jgi:hypothetical protein
MLCWDSMSNAIYLSLIYRRNNLNIVWHLWWRMYHLMCGDTRISYSDIPDIWFGYVIDRNTFIYLIGRNIDTFKLEVYDKKTYVIIDVIQYSNYFSYKWDLNKCFNICYVAAFIFLTWHNKDEFDIWYDNNYGSRARVFLTKCIMSMRSTCFEIGFHLMNVTRESGMTWGPNRPTFCHVQK